jgi:glyoxylase-like metal-dependent hydrolase (beta-lactamase superfamily II)/rhodanese-related sulfurtransferase
MRHFHRPMPSSLERRGSTFVPSSQSDIEGISVKQHQIEAMSIDVDELMTLLRNQEPVTILDLRDREERVEWVIPGSHHGDVHASLQAGKADALAGATVPAGGKVVTVCGAGKLSLIAAEQLREQGVDAFSLAGGMKAWSLAWNTACVPVPGSSEVIQVRRAGKGCLSYIMGNGGEAVVVDAALDPSIYIQLATERGWSITQILDTHIHADHLSRSRALAEQTGGVLHLPAQDRVSFPFSPVHDGDELVFGEDRLVALSTPGHTLESMTYQLNDVALFTGDTLFLSGVGRPDLEASREETLVRAGLLYHSLTMLSTLPAASIVLPGHTSDLIPFDDTPIAGSLADVLARLDVLHLAEANFVSWLTGQSPSPPPNHAAIVSFNEAGILPEGDPADLEAGANRCAVI